MEEIILTLKNQTITLKKKEIWSLGDKVKVFFGDPENFKFKRGYFQRYSKNKTHGYFIHANTGKLLHRDIESFYVDE